MSPPKVIGETRILLHDISWTTYESLLEDLQNSSAPRLTYDRGVLEIMSPNFRHENLNDAVKILVNILAVELDLDYCGAGSTTFKREDIERGFEPDSAFYFQNEPLVRGKEKIDLQIDPPPDLIVEIDITHSSLDKLSIFAQLGVAEVWRYLEDKITILRLHNGGYVVSQASGIFPFLTSAKLSQLLNESLTLRRVTWTRKAHRWARKQLKAQTDYES